MASTQAEVREFVDHVRKAGFKVVRTGSGAHQKVLNRSGAVVTDENGPLIISGSPSEHRWKEMHVHRFIKAGVFKSDPYKTDDPKKNGANGATVNGHGPEGKQKRNSSHSRITDPDVQEAKIRAIKARSDGFRERTGHIRSRLEPIVAKRGGWGHGNSIGGVKATEFADVLLTWALSRGRIELHRDKITNEPPSREATVQAINNMRKPGGTLGALWLPLFEVFVDELERNAGSPPQAEKGAARYGELLREAKGISPGPTTPAVGPPAEPVATPPEVVKVGPNYDMIHAPKLALRAMFFMARNPDASEADVVELVSQIAELELNRNR